MARQHSDRFDQTNRLIRFASASVVVAAILASCSADAVVTTTTHQVTAEEVSKFCTQYQQVHNLSRSEMMRALVDHAPQSLIGAIKRASELNVSHEEDDAIDRLINQCRTTSTT